MKASFAIMLLMLTLAACTEETMKNPEVVIQTNLGAITVELYPDQAPTTVDNFLNYTNQGFYENTIFHRVIDGFVAQAGGFEPDGTRKQTQDPIPLEAQVSNTRGTLAMARTNVPNSATSQFFINLQDNTNLDPAPGNPGYAVFGKVVEGMEIVDEIASKETTTKFGQRDWPVDDIIIISAHEK